MGGKFAAVLGRRVQGGPRGGSRDAQAVSVIELLGEGLVEIDLWDRVRICDVEGGRLIQEEVVLRRAAGRDEGRRPVGQLKADEDRPDRGWFSEEGEDPHLPATTTLRAVPRTEQGEHLIDPSQELAQRIRAELRWGVSGAGVRGRFGALACAPGMAAVGSSASAGPMAITRGRSREFGASTP